MNAKNFWNRVKTRIREKAITQEKVANACGIPFTTFRNWMSKNMVPPLDNAHRISKYIGVSLEYLISGQGKDSISKTNEEVLLLLKEAEEKLNKIRRDFN